MYYGKNHFKFTIKSVINFRSYIEICTVKLPTTRERGKYSATGRNSLCRSNRITVIVRRFIVIRRLPQRQNYALPRFVMFLLIALCISWRNTRGNCRKSQEKNRVSPKSRRCSIKKPFVADRIHEACLYSTKLARQ